MNATLDQILVIATIAGAILFFALRVMQKRKKSCDAGCGCEVAKKVVVKR